MAYVSLAQLSAAIPTDLSAQLLGVDAAALWTEIEAAVAREIDGKLAQRYSLPLADPVPAIVQNAALVLAAEAVYQMRGYYGESNPWTKRADGIRGTSGQQGGQPGLLDKIASGETPLFASAPAATRPAVAITEPAATHSSFGSRLS